jgi:hypothetical protein
MATRGLSIWRAGIVASGVFWLSIHPSWAAETAAAPEAGKTIPTPASTVAPAPAGGQLQPVPESMPTSPAGEAQGNVLPAQGPLPAAENGECPDLCVAPICSPPGRFWFRADGLIWWTNGTKLPPLVTTSPQGTPLDQAGVLPAATVLYGDQTIGDDGRGGVRATMGMWLDCSHRWDIEFDFLTLGQQNNDFYSGYSTGNPILARPFFNIQTNAQGRDLAAYTGQVEGSVAVSATNTFYSAGALLSYNLCSCDSCCPCDPCSDPCGPPTLCCCRTDLLVGFRYYNLTDSLGITDIERDTTTGPTSGSRYVVYDNFHAKNEFYGSEIGLRTQIYRGRWSLEVLTKLAIGNTHETVTIGGQTTITPPTGSSSTYNAGILASEWNSGTRYRDEFTVIPQLGLELGYQVNCHWRAYLGYDLLYWACVAKAAEQIDLNVDPRNIPPQQTGALHFPAFSGRQSSFWAQGLHLGAEFRF